MAILATGNSFSAGDQVTATALNAAVNSATFDTGSVDDSTTALSSGAIIVKDGGVTAAKLSTGGPTWTTGGILKPGDLTFTNANPEILGGDNDGSMLVSPGTTTSNGGNFILYGGSHATKAKDIEFRATAGVELHYDDSASKWDFQANAIDTTGAATFSGGGALTGTWSDLGTVTTMDLNGGTIDGTVIGGAAAAAGNFTTLGASGLTTLAADLVFSQANPEIRGGDTDGVMYISPSTTNALGGNILLYGDTHATKAKDIELRATAGVELHYDDSASTFDFQANAITTTGALTTTGAFTSVGINDDATSVAITIDSSERVGIAHTTPSTALQVVGDIRVGSDSTEDLVFSRGVPAVTTGGSAVAGIISTTGTSGAAGHVGIEIPSNDVNDGFYIATDSDQDGTVDKLAVKILANGNVGIGTTTPDAALEVAAANSGGTVPSLSADTALVVNGTGGNAELSILADSTSGFSILNFGDEANEDVGNITYDHANDVMQIGSTVEIDVSGAKVGINTATPTVALDISSDSIRVRNSGGPATAASAGDAGTIQWDSDYIYVCVASSTWKRAALSTW